MITSSHFGDQYRSCILLCNCSGWRRFSCLRNRRQRSSSSECGALGTRACRMFLQNQELKTNTCFMFTSTRWPPLTACILNLGAIVRHELGSTLGRKPFVKNGNLRISVTRGRFIGSGASSRVISADASLPILGGIVYWLDLMRLYVS